MKNVQKRKLPKLIKGLIGNYNQGFNIEHAKLVLEKGPNGELVVESQPTATKQAAGKEGDPAGFLYMYPSLI